MLIDFAIIDCITLNNYMSPFRASKTKVKGERGRIVAHVVLTTVLKSVEKVVFSSISG